MIDTHVVEIFKRYYTLLQRDNPDNRGSAMQAAATLTQAHITREEVDKLLTPYQIDYSLKIDDIKHTIDDIKNTFSVSLEELVDEIKLIRKRM